MLRPISNLPLDYFRVGLAVTALLGATATAQEISVTEPAPKKTGKAAGRTKDPHLKHLVEQLGDSSFLKRRVAHDRLVRLGLKAKPALQAALRHPDLEIRMAAHRILIHAVQEDFESRLAAFIADVKDTRDHHMPGWKGFRDIAGPSRGARRLFAEMIRAETPMLAAMETNNISEKFNKRVQDLRNRMYSSYQQRTEMTSPTMATLLYVACHPKIEKSVSAASNMNSLLSYNNTMTAFTSGNNHPIMKKLLRNWILRKGQSYSQKYYGVSLSLNYNLRDTGIKLAREIMATPNVPSYIVQYAAIAIGKYGEKKDVSLLLPHLKDLTVCHTWSNPQIKKEPIRIQVRDVVMAMVIHLSGENPKNYGYKLLIDSPSTMYTVYSFGFLSDNDRNQTIKKWNEFAKKNKISHQIPVIASPTPKKTPQVQQVPQPVAKPAAAATVRDTKPMAKKADKKKPEKKRADTPKVEKKAEAGKLPEGLRKALRRAFVIPTFKSKKSNSTKTDSKAKKKSPPQSNRGKNGSDKPTDG